MSDAIRVWIAGLIALLLVLAAGVWIGWGWHEARTAKAEVKDAAQVVKTVEKQQAVTAKIATNHEKARERIVTVTRTITKEIPRYVTKEAVSRCDVPNGFVRVLDAAAAGSVPDAPRQSDADPSGVGIDTVAGSVVGNYGTCQETRQQLIDLQAWVREQEAPSKIKLRR